MTAALLCNRKVLAAAAITVAVPIVALLGMIMAITGAGFGCTSAAAAPSPSTGAASPVIPKGRVRLYQAAGRRFDIDWAFLASIGAQECHHGSCAGDNGSGCAGPMQIAVRRGSPCSPGSGETLWERYGVDADHDGDTDPDDPADAIFTAARILREAKHAPPAGGSYKDYYKAACGYYGACGDSTAHYADEVMDRAVAYGFGNDQPETSGGCGGASLQPAGNGTLDPVVRDRSPGGLTGLPIAITGGAQIDCDRRIRTDVIRLARRYRVRVTACSAIHSTGGEHPLGAAVDLVPATGMTWPASTERLARAVGWKRSCAASGTRACR